MGKPLTTQGFVLSKKQTGENYLNLCFFSENLGKIYCLYRGFSKKKAQPQPDLFDLASLTLEEARTKNSYFIKEYQLLNRFAGLGKHYDRLYYGAQYASLLENNLTHSQSLDFHYRLTLQVLDALENSPFPEATYLKALYLLTREEGYPIKEHWYYGLNGADQNLVSQTINKPLAEQTESREQIKRITSQLQSWLVAHTDIIV